MERWRDKERERKRVAIELTESSNKLNSANNVCSEMSVNGTVGSIEDGNGVEDDGIDSTELLKYHGSQTQNKWMPDLFGLQLTN